MTRAILIAAMLAASSAVLAHGDAEWIRANPQTHWCCDERDCARARPDEAVEIEADVWRVTKAGQSRVFRRGERGFYDSIDADAWLCAASNQPPRCFFAPPKGM